MYGPVRTVLWADGGLIAPSDPIAYVAELKKRSHGRGVVKLRRLLHLKRTYPGEPFLKAIKQALKYGLFDLSRLENIVLDA